MRTATISIPPSGLNGSGTFSTGNPDYIAISGAFQSISADGKPVSMLAHTGEPRDITDTLRSGETVSHICSLLIRKEALEATGYFRDWFKIAFDIDLQFLLADVGRIWARPDHTGLSLQAARCIPHPHDAHRAAPVLRPHGGRIRSTAARHRGGRPDARHASPIRRKRPPSPKRSFRPTSTWRANFTARPGAALAKAGGGRRSG